MLPCVTTVIDQRSGKKKKKRARERRTERKRNKKKKKKSNKYGKYIYNILAKCILFARDVRIAPCGWGVGGER